MPLCLACKLSSHLLFFWICPELPQPEQLSSCLNHIWIQKLVSKLVSKLGSSIFLGFGPKRPSSGQSQEGGWVLEPSCHVTFPHNGLKNTLASTTFPCCSTRKVPTDSAFLHDGKELIKSVTAKAPHPQAESNDCIDHRLPTSVLRSWKLPDLLGTFRDYPTCTNMNRQLKLIYFQNPARGSAYLSCSRLVVRVLTKEGAPRFTSAPHFPLAWGTLASVLTQWHFCILHVAIG